MTTLIIILVLILIIVVSIFIIATQRKKIKAANKEADAEKHKKENLEESIDIVMMYNKDNNKSKDKTRDNVEILRKSKETKDVEKELVILRDNIFAEYSKLQDN